MTGLYVHIPFCSIKCFYCDFAAFSGQGRTVSRYLAALKKEAALLKFGDTSLNSGETELSEVSPNFVPETLYIGGGTPSELTADQIEELFQLIREAYPGSDWSEITFEASPESLTREKLVVLREFGVTRLSLGFQTLDAGLLKGIGRKHSPEDSLRAYRLAREAGGMALSVDLMYGLPGQALSQLKASLKAALDLEPEHLSLYGLQVEDGTLFAKREVVSDEYLGREMFESALDMIASAGFHHYEISNFAKPGFESKHNINYWKNGSYAGLGCGAASFLGGERRTNEERLIGYCEKIEAGKSAVAEAERLEGKEKLGESVWLGLRLIDGLDLTPEMQSEFEPQWRDLAAKGLVAIEADGRVRLARQGIFLANQVFQEFVPPFLNKGSAVEAV